MALIAARVNAEVILVVTYPPPYPLPPSSPSPISLMVTVDVKQRLYLLTSSTKRVFRKLLGTFNACGRGGSSRLVSNKPAECATSETI